MTGKKPPNWGIMIGGLGHGVGILRPTIRFRALQQHACKLMAKLRTKAITPKKQTHNPYPARDEKVPDWWPKPWGPAKDDKIRHVESGHLLKKGPVFSGSSPGLPPPSALSLTNSRTRPPPGPHFAARRRTQRDLTS